MRAVWAVGSNAGYPPEAFVLFAAEADARRHVELAAYAFTAFALAVYDRAADLPPWVRGEAHIPPHWREEYEFAELLDPAPAADVHAVRAFDQPDDSEVWALLEDTDEAASLADAVPWAAEWCSLHVYDSYAAVPRAGRYLEPGGRISQLFGLRGG